MGIYAELSHLPTSKMISAWRIFDGVLYDSQVALIHVSLSAATHPVGEVVLVLQLHLPGSKTRWAEIGHRRYGGKVQGMRHEA